MEQTQKPHGFIAQITMMRAIEILKENNDFILIKEDEENEGLWEIITKNPAGHFFGKYPSYLSVPNDKIIAVEEYTYTIKIVLNELVISIWKNHMSMHVTIFDN